jgi:phage/plasmid-associated DNA primase
MTYTLGEYSGTVPITLVTEKRNSIGGTSSEVIQLKGIRYAVMQEPSKDARINEGVMKELTGGDKIQARALYSASETFIPQFKLCVCTNSLFEINSNDDGTWRRIRICEFLAKFVDKIDGTEPHQFLKDRTLEEKLYTWAPVFASMLAERAFTTNGLVEDCEMVLASSNKYRQGQDHLAAYVNDRLVFTQNPEDQVGKKGLSSDFKDWFQATQGMRKAPKGAELYEYLDKRFGKCKGSVWIGVRFNQVYENEAFVLPDNGGL